MVRLLLGYDTASRLAADALFGGSGDLQKHSEAQPQILIIHWPWSSSMVRGDAWCTLGWGEAWSPQLDEEYSYWDPEEEDCLCAVDCAWFELRSPIEDHQIADGQNRRAAIEFRHRLLRDLGVATVGWEYGFKERQEA